MTLKRILLDYVPNAPDLALLPALRPEDIRQRDNETNFQEPIENYPLNGAEADRIAEHCWAAVGCPE